MSGPGGRGNNPYGFRPQAPLVPVQQTLVGGAVVGRGQLRAGAKPFSLHPHSGASSSTAPPPSTELGRPVHSQPSPVHSQPSSTAPTPSTELSQLSLGRPVQSPVQVAPAPQWYAGPDPVAVPLVPSSSKLHKAPARPGVGTIGRKCMITANHFLVDISNKDPHQYDVTITPEVTSKSKCKAILKCLTEKYHTSHLGNRRLAYDGKKSAFAAGSLPFESKEFVVTVPDNKEGKTRDFKVNIKFAAKKEVDHLRQFLNGRRHDNPQETIQALDVVLRETASKGREIVGRSIFSPEFEQGPLGNGIDYWRGFYQSLRPTQMGLSLNIDMAARAFYSSTLVSDFVMDYLGKDVTRPLSDQDRIRLKKVLKGVRVEVSRGADYKRSYKVQNLTQQSINQLTFPVVDGSTISVVTYFREKYKLNLKYPFLPAIQAGTDSKPTYLPMEICKLVESQRYTKKLNERQVTAMLKATCRRPRDRESEIDRVLKGNKYNQDKLVKEDFGLRVREQLTSIEARVLPPPPLKYHQSGRQSEILPAVGQWNMIELKMINGGKVNFWAVVNFSRNRQDAVDRFVHGIISMCQDKGMAFNPRPLIPPQTAAPHNVEKALYDIHSQSSGQLARVAPGQSLQILFVILPETSGSYGKIKKVCETELGIVSQCCQPKHVMKMNRQYFENVALKVNVKVGGTNTVLSKQLQVISERPTIIFGADVTHPQPGEDSGPSIAAVVASVDWPHVTKYRALVSSQPHRQEIIEDLYTTVVDEQKGIVHKGMIKDHLIAFRRATGQKPHRIIFYRDGVSEGQFNDVLVHEMDKIRKACVSLEEDYMPRVTFIVVQKRHHTRLFPMNHGDRASTDRSGNILPGTVVDTKICHPTEFDFYLCSHAGIQGTSRPAHYHVLYDENKFSADALQMLTNSLCYTYARCTRSVSIVPPAYYAHLTAFRARYYTEGMGASESDSAVKTTREKTAEVRAVPMVRDNVKAVMFYC
ncbi:protein argonaute MEL1-like [Rutidosis leptorrhynchoides]|uniref:protein argonaute MEL1-like n=1 Tax=Rutidosis leptorrhynchoides TaxID=125765 RepID=UPI003A992336